MTSGRVLRAWRVFARGAAIALLSLVLLLLAGCPYAGRFLIVEQRLTTADAIVVLAGADVERWLEAVDLYREGLAPRILMSPGYVDPLGNELRARGIRLPREVDIHKDAMRQLGVPDHAIEILPHGYDNTADEAAGVRAVVQPRGWTRLIVVTSKYHTRRARFAFERELRGSGIAAQVRGSRYDRARPDGWWRHRSDLRYVVSELQKLAAYRFGLGK